MFLYTEKDIESEYDIQNNNLLCTIPKQSQHTFEQIVFFELIEQIMNN